jgi:hypothetical protein
MAVSVIVITVPTAWFTSMRMAMAGLFNRVGRVNLGARAAVTVLARLREAPFARFLYLDCAVRDAVSAADRLGLFEGLLRLVRPNMHAQRRLARGQRPIHTHTHILVSMDAEGKYGGRVRGEGYQM